MTIGEKVIYSNLHGAVLMTLDKGQPALVHATNDENCREWTGVGLEEYKWHLTKKNEKP